MELVKNILDIKTLIYRIFSIIKKYVVVVLNTVNALNVILPPSGKVSLSVNRYWSKLDIHDIQL